MVCKDFQRFPGKMLVEICDGKRCICGAPFVIPGRVPDYGCLTSANTTRSRPRRSPTLVGHSHLLSKVEHPTFDYSVPTNVTTQLGQTVYLHCKVHNLGDKV
ncbi:hypothetical protein AVEN_219218-1, partial [Araneus ventricosus]